MVLGVPAKISGRINAADGYFEIPNTGNSGFLIVRATGLGYAAFGVYQYYGAFAKQAFNGSSIFSIQRESDGANIKLYATSATNLMIVNIQC